MAVLVDENTNVTFQGLDGLLGTAPDADVIAAAQRAVKAVKG